MARKPRPRKGETADRDAEERWRAFQDFGRKLVRVPKKDIDAELERERERRQGDGED
jgi:hypothetical protein